MIAYQLTDKITARKIADESFVLDRSRGMVHTFNSTGARLWEFVCAGKTFDEMVAGLCSEYSVDISNARKDVFDFLMKLQSEGLLIVIG